MNFDGPFTSHMKEAIFLNRQRMPLYAKLTDGKSIPASKKLLRSQLYSLPFYYFIDFLAKPFQKAGIPIGDIDFMNMDLTPIFSEKYAFQPEPLTAFKPIQSRSLLKKLKTAYKKDGFEGLSKAASHELEQVNQHPTYHAMIRHLLESIIRVANLAPIHEKKARELNFRSPVFISRLIIWSHYPAFAFGAKFDEDLAPFQAKGIPIFAQDVPRVLPH